MLRRTFSSVNLTLFTTSDSLQLYTKKRAKAHLTSGRYTALTDISTSDATTWSLGLVRCLRLGALRSSGGDLFSRVTSVGRGWLGERSEYIVIEKSAYRDKSDFMQKTLVKEKGTSRLCVSGIYFPKGESAGNTISVSLTVRRSE